MAGTFKFYRDANLTQELTTPLEFTQYSDGSYGAQVQSLWFGSTYPSRRVSVKNAPLDPIEISIADALVGQGQPTTAVKLSLTGTDFATQVAGAALSLGVTSLDSGVANAKRIYIQVTDQTGTLGYSVDVSLHPQALTERVVV